MLSPADPRMERKKNKAEDTYKKNIENLQKKIIKKKIKGFVPPHAVRNTTTIVKQRGWHHDQATKLLMIITPKNIY